MFWLRVPAGTGTVSVEPLPRFGVADEKVPPRPLFSESVSVPPALPDEVMLKVALPPAAAVSVSSNFRSKLALVVAE